MKGKVFTVQQKVLFRHCDPAGIVFFPRYLEMVNDAVEAFFDGVLKMPFEILHKTGATPTVALTTEFPAASFHGDMLEISITPSKLGRTSLGLNTIARCDGETRFICDATLVFINTRGKPTPWPSSVKDNIAADFGEHNDT
ncbi:MAG: thioesterase family protein [Paracoccaceae bacterium]